MILVATIRFRAVLPASLSAQLAASTREWRDSPPRIRHRVCLPVRAAVACHDHLPPELWTPPRTDAVAPLLYLVFKQHEWVYHQHST